MALVVRSRLFLLITILALGSIGALNAAPQSADTAYRNGYIYTVDPKDTVRSALAIRDATIVYVGGNRGLSGFIGPNTKIIDLRGRMLMPGLVDGHMHPMFGGLQQLTCNLNYEALRTCR
jgi:predicted amidohydrolase YtcJ